MKLRHDRFLGVLAVSACFLFLGTAWAEGGEQKVKMSDLPKAVQKTVQEQSKGATVRGLSKEVEDGKTYYEVEMTVDGHGKDVTIDGAGTVVEVEEEVALSSLPPAVKSALEKKAGAGKIVKIESVTKGSAIVAYEAKIEEGG